LIAIKLAKSYVSLLHAHRVLKCVSYNHHMARSADRRRRRGTRNQTPSRNKAEDSSWENAEWPDSMKFKRGTDCFLSPDPIR
jgi:hypothetical protein